MVKDILNQIDTPIIGEGDLKSSAVAIVLTENDEVILEALSETIGHQPGDICLPGGGLEDGETPEQAAARELMEELQIVRWTRSMSVSFREKSALFARRKRWASAARKRTRRNWNAYIRSAGRPHFASWIVSGIF